MRHRASRAHAVAVLGSGSSNQLLWGKMVLHTLVQRLLCLRDCWVALRVAGGRQ
jgi:hypothetical protein